MEMTGEQSISLSQQRVWDALNDPAVLKECIAGCESLVKVSDDEFKIVMLAAVGPVRAKFTGKLLLRDLKAPDSYALVFEGSGGGAGFGKGTATIALSPDGSGTRLAYRANASVGGKLAQVGSRLIEGVARKMAEDFFTKFKKLLSPPVDAVPPRASLPARKSVRLWVVGIGAMLLVVVGVIALKAT
jgi:hypothetical protein